MNKLKLILIMALAFVVLFAQVGNAAAAPLTQTPTDITGTVTGISFESDANGVITVLVTLVDDQNVTQTVRISEATAITQGLLQLDPLTGEPVLDTVTGLPLAVVLDLNNPLSVTIAAGDIILDAPVEEAVHPIAALLAGFFDEDASVIDGYHTDDGFGFGVIAQALWMSKNMNEDASLAGQILDAKKTGDYSAFAEYFENGTVPTNWGQFRKALLNKKQNLGVVVSGQDDENNNSNQPEHGNGKDKDKGKDNNNGQGNGNGNGNNKNKDKGKDH